MLASCLGEEAQVLGSGTASDFCPLGMCTGVSILGHRNSHRHVHTYALINQPLEQSVFKKRKQRKAYIFNLNSAYVTVPTMRQVNCSRQGHQRGNLGINSKAKTLDKDSLRSGHFRKCSILGHFHMTAVAFGSKTSKAFFF